MDTTIIIFCIVGGALMGALITALVLQRRHAQISTQVGVLEAQLKSDAAQTERLLKEKEQTHLAMMQEKEQANLSMMQEKEQSYFAMLQEKEQAHLTMMQEKDRVHQEALRTLQAKFDEMTMRYTNEMKVATNDMLQQRQKEFTDRKSTRLNSRH